MSFFQILKIFFSYVLKYKGRYTLMLVGLFVSSLCTSIIPLFYKDIVSIAQSGNATQMYQPLAFIAITIIGEFLFNQLMLTAIWRIQFPVIQDIKADIINIIHKQDYHYHTSKSSGKLIATISRVNPAIFGLLVNFNQRALKDLCLSIIPIIFILSLSFVIGIVVIISFLITLPLLYFSLRYNLKRRKLTYEPESNLTGAVVDNMIGFETIKAFAKEDIEKKRFNNLSDIFTTALIKYSDTFRFVDLTLYITSLTILVAGITASIIEFQSGHIGLSSLVAIVGLLLPFPTRLTDLFFEIREVFKNSSDFESFAEILMLKPAVTDTENPIIIEHPQGALAFQDVCFGYGNKNTIHDVNLTIQTNQKIAFVGPSGAGKSTLTKLLLRYYDVSSGSITIDNIDIRLLSQQHLRQLIGIVPQDPIPFNNSISFNVGYALDNPSDDDIINACKLAQIHTFIDSLPDKYNTIVGERGIKLSGGQRQRLAIARMILKNPKILIFDEATSALDSESENLIQAAFAEVSKDKTTIIIAHRLSTVVHCDCIFVIDDGKIIQSGTHTELVNQEGLYKKLWTIQSGGFL